MANRVINTILNLRDNMSGGLIRAARNTAGVTREMESATRSVVAFKNRAGSAINSAAKSFVKFGTSAAGVTAALAAKTGLSEAMDLEGYRLQLETATKDTQKASEIMQYAINLANKTPLRAASWWRGRPSSRPWAWQRRNGCLWPATWQQPPTRALTRPRRP